jgi:hypothetical protein
MQLGRSFAHKSVVMAAIQRGGAMRAKVRPNVTAQELERFIREHIEPNTELMPDNAKGFRRRVCALRGTYKQRGNVVFPREAINQGDVQIYLEEALAILP